MGTGGNSLQTHIQSLDLLQGVEFFHRVDLLLADEVGDGHHRPLTPVLPLHHHPIAEQLQRGVLGDAVALGYVGWGWGREVKQREGKSIDEEEEAG